MFKMTASGYNALLKPSINGTANVSNYFNKNIAAGIFNFLLKFFERSRFPRINNVINPYIFRFNNLFITNYRII